MNQKLTETIEHCRICSATELKMVLELGEQPPANSLRKQLKEELPSSPLTIARCSECATIQLTETVNPEFLFQDYVWVTGTSATAQKHSQYFYQEVKKREPAEGKFVIEVASNDGTFLKTFQDNNHRVLGVDPAKNIAAIANDRRVPTVPDFFGKEVAQKVTKEHGLADVIFARNVIPHVKNVHDVIEGMANSIKNSGTAIIEFHYSQKILAELHYDSIYHEHLFYFSIKSISVLLEKYGLYGFDVEESPISGGSLILFCSKDQSKALSSKLKKYIELEQELGTNSETHWNTFAQESQIHKKELVSLIQGEKAKGSKIIGYGASARSSTLLNFCEIDHEYLDVIADKSSIKHDKYTPGTNILIVEPDIAMAQEPDVILLLAWNFTEELLEVLKSQYDYKGKVILPLPNSPRIIQL